MLEGTRAAPTPECLSDLVLDQWHADELSAGRQSECEQHIRLCPACAARHQQVEQAANDFVERYPQLNTPTPALSRPNPRQPTALNRRLRRLPWEFVGGAFFVKRGDRVFRGQSGMVVHPGDFIRFSAHLSSPKYLAVLSKDGDGATSTYFAEEVAVTPAASQAGQPLANSVRLDAAMGAEQVWAVFCSAPVDSAPLTAQLQRADTLTPPNGCTTELLTWSKQ